MWNSIAIAESLRDMLKNATSDAQIQLSLKVRVMYRDALKEHVNLECAKKQAFRAILALPADLDTPEGLAVLQEIIDAFVSHMLRYRAEFIRNGFDLSIEELLEGSDPLKISI